MCAAEQPLLQAWNSHVGLWATEAHVNLPCQHLNTIVEPNYHSAVLCCLQMDSMDSCFDMQGSKGQMHPRGHPFLPSQHSQVLLPCFPVDSGAIHHPLMRIPWQQSTHPKIPLLSQTPALQHRPRHAQSRAQPGLNHAALLQHSKQQLP